MQNFLYTLIFYMVCSSILLAQNNIFYPTEVPKRHDELSFSFFAGHYENIGNNTKDINVYNQLLLNGNSGYNIGVLFNPLYNVPYTLNKIDIMINSKIEANDSNNYMINIFLNYNIIKNNQLRFYVGYSLIGKTNVLSYDLVENVSRRNTFDSKGYIIGIELFVFNNLSFYIDYEALQSNQELWSNYAKPIAKSVNIGSKIHINFLSY